MSIRVKYYYGANARIVDKVIIHLQTDRAVTAAKSYFSLNNIKVNDAVIVYKEQYDGFRAANTSLTVQEHSPKSHSGIGWEEFTDAAVAKLAEEKENLVFMLWGSDAIKKGAKIDRNRHLVLTSPDRKSVV